MPKLTEAETALALRDMLPRVKIVGFSTTGEELGEQTLAETGSMWILSKRDGLEVAATGMALLPAPPVN